MIKIRKMSHEGGGGGRKVPKWVPSNLMAPYIMFVSKVSIGFYNTKLFFAFYIPIDFSKGFSAAKNPENIRIQHLPSLVRD